MELSKGKAKAEFLQRLREKHSPDPIRVHANKKISQKMHEAEIIKRTHVASSKRKALAKEKNG